MKELQEWRKKMAIRREITVTRKGLNSPIDIVHETNLLPFEFVVTDFNIPSASIAVAYVEGGDNNVKKQICEINDNVISFTPETTLFDEGKNILQLRVTHDEKNLFSFSEIVNCSGKIEMDDAEDAKTQPTLTEQLLTLVGNVQAELKNQQETIQTLTNNRSQVGDIICNANLDTMEKVIQRFGGTKWERIEDRFLLGASEKYPVGTLGGEKEVTLTIKQIPKHTHGLTQSFKFGSGGSAATVGYSSETGSSYTTGSAGEGEAHNNMSPYKAVYMWERTE